MKKSKCQKIDSNVKLTAQKKSLYEIDVSLRKIRECEPFFETSSFFVIFWRQVTSVWFSLARIRTKTKQTAIMHGKMEKEKEIRRKKEMKRNIGKYTKLCGAFKVHQIPDEMMFDVRQDQFPVSIANHQFLSFALFFVRSFVQ